ncbi:MAG: CNNM domain-containing protein [Bacteroidota bacterium]|nr:CNNM domain-containing protein [Candidatus Kapabacteria bacterium]MDW8221055.1 CNNM domain-containing protein [Bacteroidota bacterium]
MIELAIIALLTFSVTAIISFIAAAFHNLSHHILTERAASGHALAEKLLEYKRDSNSPRSALFLIDTVVSTLGCIGIGGYAVFAFDAFRAIAVSIVLTLVLLVLGRMLPRALGQRYAHSVIGFVAHSLRIIMFGMQPITTLVERFFLLFAPPTKDDDEVVREELDEILETAHDEGSLDIGEYQRLKNFVRFNEVLVSDVMTPRTVIFSCSCDMTVEETIKLPELQQYSRFPIYEADSIDSVIGYVLTKDVLWAFINRQHTLQLRELSREVYFIPENIDLDRALQNFLERRQHLFVVVDEYGGVEGLITMEDVMETLLGAEILDEVDKISNLRALAAKHRDERIASLRAQNAHVDNSAEELTTDTHAHDTAPSVHASISQNISQES